MTKKELETKLEKLQEELGELRYVAKEYQEAKEDADKLRGAIHEIQAEKRTESVFMADQIKNLTLRIDILTLTPEQIETMRRIKSRGRIENPLDLTDRQIDYRERI